MIDIGVQGPLAFLLAAYCLMAGLPAAAAEQRAIVIDPGHGGLDVGAKGKFGSVEKDIDLAISRKLKALIEQNQAYRVVLTRNKDIDVSLENRAAIANNNDALVFLSVHVNASFRKKAQGSETYFMSLNATDEEARHLAFQENREAALDRSISGTDKNDIKMILWDMAQSAYVKQSSQLAELIQAQLNLLLGTDNRGIKQADFVVLRGVACPAVLVEAAFISNPEEEQKLSDDAFQNNVAQAIYAGLMRFLAVLGKTERVMKTPRWPVLIAFLVALTVLIFLFIKGFAPEKIANPGETPPSATAPETPVNKETMKAVLYFQRDDGLFVAETRDVPSTGSVSVDAETVLNELIKGSADGGLVSTVPPETKLRQVFLTKDGTAYVDFTKDLATAHPSGTDAETATIYAIVDTLAANFNAVKKVFILIDGAERETLNGHVTLDRPYLPDLSLIAKS